MIEEVNLNSLILNITQNKSKYCRFCLRETLEISFGFEDFFSLNEGSYDISLAEILSQVLGLETETEDLPGLDVICIACLDKILESARFVNQCKRSTVLLNNVFDNLLISLNAVDAVHRNDLKTLCITVKEHDSHILLVDDESKGNKTVKAEVDDEVYNHQTSSEDNEPRKKRSYKWQLFECLECEMMMNSFIELKAHNLNCHNSLTCDKCLDQFLNSSELDSHLIHKHQHKCSYCGQYRSSETALKVHEDRAHSTYLCKDCGKSCKGLDKLYYHENSHHQSKKCPQCGKQYRISHLYLKHVNLCMQGLLDPHPERSILQRSYSCEKCGKSYSTPGGLRVHMRFEHGNAQYHLCMHCGKKFTAPSYLKIHLLKHTGEKNYKCDICNNSFVSKESLLYHKRRHVGEKPYACKLCDERFVNASARAEHKKFKHIGPQLQCPYCPRKFMTQDLLRKHMERHKDPQNMFLHKWKINPDVNENV